MSLVDQDVSPFRHNMCRLIMLLKISENYILSVYRPIHSILYEYIITQPLAAMFCPAAGSLLPYNVFFCLSLVSLWL